mgnify:CR=1 FL=1
MKRLFSLAAVLLLAACAGTGGQVVAVVGHTGAGKSTICQHLTGKLTQAVLLDSDILWRREFDVSPQAILPLIVCVVVYCALALLLVAAAVQACGHLLAPALAERPSYLRADHDFARAHLPDHLPDRVTGRVDPRHVAPFQRDRVARPRIP